MLDFSVNTNPFGPPPSLLKVLRKNVSVIGEYPDHLNTEIFAVLGTFLGVSVENIALGVGSTQILFDIPKLLLYKRAVIIAPTFWEYTAFNSLFEKNVRKIELLEENNFEPDYSSIQRVLKSGDCVFICNINNPTSVLYNKKSLLRLVENNPSIQFVIDETYLLFRSDFAEQSLVKQAEIHENLHVVLSLSKFFSIPGLRLGILASGRKTVNNYNELFHIPYSVSPLALIAFAHLLKSNGFILKTREFYDKERKRLFTLLGKKLEGRLQCFKPEGSFIMGRILTGQKSQDIKESLREKGILVRGGHELLDVTDDWIRFSMRSTMNNNILVKELDIVLKFKAQ